MVRRNIAPHVKKAATWYPVVTLTGPRQSGKTTLCRALFPRHAYVTLEAPDVRAWAQSDPRGLLAEHRGGIVIDEVQHVPELLSYIHEEVDKNPKPGRFVLTGSQNLALNAAVSQSLAGRTAVLHLLPLSLDEVRRFPNAPRDPWETVWMGGYPRILDQRIPAERWLSDYVSTTLERDVRQLLAVGDLVAFASFLRLCAGRTACELNRSDLGRDAGVSHNTIQSWLSVLEAMWLAIRLPPWHRNVSKQQVKAPKLHLLDTGLVCWLLGIRKPGDLVTHPLRGAIFETWVVTEVLKWRLHRGLPADLFHYRESRALELDLLVGNPPRIATEIKSGATIATDWLDTLARWDEGRRHLVHGGDAAGVRRGIRLVPWNKLAATDWD